MNVILLGAPGSGKGTQSSNLVQKLGLSHYSTGDMLRAAIAKGTALGQEAKSYMAAGKLVSDDLVIGIVKEAIAADQNTKGFVFDGFPRTTAQADALTQMLLTLGKKIDVALFFDVPFTLIAERVTGRRSCVQCGAIHHIQYAPPTTANTCNSCGHVGLLQRPDDTEAVVSQRLKAYESSTAPLIEYYRQKGLLKTVDGVGELSAVYQRIVNSLGPL